MSISSAYTFSSSIAEYTNATGLDNYVLLGAITGYFTFADAENRTSGDSVTYHVTDGPNVEIVTGIYTEAGVNPASLSRDTILSSSNNGEKVFWGGQTRPIIRELTSASINPGTDFEVGAVNFTGNTTLWNWPAMSDSGIGSMSVWLYLTRDQWGTSSHAPALPDGDLFNLSSSALFSSPFNSLQRIACYPARTSSGTLGSVTNISNAYRAIVTFNFTHNIRVGAYVFIVVSQIAWSTFTNRTYLVENVTATTITISADTSGLVAYAPSGPANVYCENAPLFTFSNNGATSDYTAYTLRPIPHDRWVNLLASWNMNLSAGNKILNVFYDDTDVTLERIDDISSAFSIKYSYASVGANDSWAWGGLDFGHVGCVCYMADAWFAPGQYIDFSIKTNRDKFHDATNRPIFLGNDGSVPTGVAPLLYLHIDSDETDASQFAVNMSGAGSLTVAGTALSLAPIYP